MIHSGDRIPLTTSQGLVVAPNSETRIALEEIKLERQPPPYTSECKSEWGTETKVPYDGMPYNDQLCENFCLDDYIQNKCKCTASGIIEANRNLSETCDNSDMATALCLYDIQNNIDGMIAEIKEK